MNHGYLVYSAYIRPENQGQRKFEGHICTEPRRIHHVNMIYIIDKVAFLFCFYSIIDLLVLLVVVLFDDVATKDAEEGDEGRTSVVEFKRREKLIVQSR